MSENSKDKFVVEEIQVPDNEMQKLNKVLKSTVMTKSKTREIRAVLGGTCSACFFVPTKKVIYDVKDGDKLVDYYCSECFEKNKSKLHLRLENMNFT